VIFLRIDKSLAVFQDNRYAISRERTFGYSQLKERVKLRKRLKQDYSQEMLALREFERILDSEPESGE